MVVGDRIMRRWKMRKVEKKRRSREMIMSWEVSAFDVE